MFKFGFNIESITIIFWAVLSICVLVALGYFVGNLDCNKKSKSVIPTKSLKEETGWTSDNFEKLKDKIKLENAEIFTGKFSISPDIPDLLDCVTHTFTLKYNDPKLIDDSNFDSRVKQLIIDCKESMRKTEEDPKRYPDSDPGPPVWSPSVIKKFKGMFKRMLTIEPYEPTSSRITPKSPDSEQLDCILHKLQSEFKYPRDMIKIFRTNENQTKELIIRITGECNYNIRFNTAQGVIIWDDQTRKILENLLKSLYSKSLNDSGIACLTKQISDYTNDIAVLTDHTKLKAIVSPVLILQCKQIGDVPEWTEGDLKKINNQLIFQDKLGRQPTLTESNCFLIKLMERFSSLEKVKEHDQRHGPAFIDEIMNDCNISSLKL
jgi:hypothetical protein